MYHYFKRQAKIIYIYIKAIFLLRYKENIKQIFIFPFYHIGGGEKVHLEIVKSFKKKNTICIFTHTSEDDRYKIEFTQNSNIIEYNVLSLHPTIKKEFVKRLIKRLNNSSKKITLFGCNTPYFYNLLPTITNSKIKKIDLLHAFSFPDEGMEKISINFVELLDKRVVINSKTYHDYAAQYSDYNIDEKYLQRINVIENTISKKGTKKTRNNTKLKVAFIGRDSKEKRLELFERISKKLKEKFDFVVAGNTKTSPYYESFGKISEDEKLNNFYQEIDILLITSYREGFPMVIKEAMSNGVVCISTNVGSIEDHIKNNETGFILENISDEESVIQNFVAILNLLNDDRSILKRISEESYDYSNNNFIDEIFREKYRKLIDE